MINMRTLLVCGWIALLPAGLGVTVHSAFGQSLNECDAVYYQCMYEANVDRIECESACYDTWIWPFNKIIRQRQIADCEFKCELGYEFQAVTCSATRSGCQSASQN